MAEQLAARTIKNGRYPLTNVPEDYPGVRYNRGRYCGLSHYVYWEEHGIVPGENELIHHKDGDVLNNEITNLELTTTEEHNHMHHYKGLTGEVTCLLCGKRRMIPINNYRYHAKHNKMGQFCSTSCSAKYQWALKRQPATAGQGT